MCAKFVQGGTKTAVVKVIERHKKDKRISNYNVQDRKGIDEIAGIDFDGNYEPMIHISIAIIEDEKLDSEGTHELVERAFRSGGIPESGTEIVDLMTKKPSRFGGSKAYTTVKQRIIDKLKTFYERFVRRG